MYKDQQRRRKIYQAFYLGGTIAVKVTERSSAEKTWFCLVYKGQPSFLVWNPSLSLNILRRSRPFSLQLFSHLIMLLFCPVTRVSKTKMATKV